MEHMSKVFDPAPLDECVPGDIIIYWVDKNTKHPQHVGILTDVGIIHTYDHVGRVVETHTHPKWQARMAHCFKWRGIE